MTLVDRLRRLPPERLLGMRRGVEKESLRALPAGTLALTPHPAALGSPLTHPHITTDFSESQLELITGVHGSVEACVDELTQVHQFTHHTLAAMANGAGDERMWASSMPCGLPTDETIPLGRYGSSNIGRAKSVYRMGLGHRYGRRMQTISGIHYNWSLPGLSNDEHFALIRNFRRHSFVLLWLFGASPAVCASFVAGRDHGLQPINHSHLANTLYLPHATSLRMGRLGYQSDAQSELSVSYNSLQSYAATLHEALTQRYAPYEALGVRNLGGEYNQLSTTLLQIENEFYGTIRPKRVINSGERPLHALRERGVEYIEVRCMDLDPFEPLGIAAPTMRFIDMFLLHCLLQDSPPDTPDEIAALGRNQHRTAAFGREPGLQLERHGQQIPLVAWAAELLAELQPIATVLDAAQGSSAHLPGKQLQQGNQRANRQDSQPDNQQNNQQNNQHQQVLDAALAALAASHTLPSARVLAAMQAQHGGSHIDFIRMQSELARQHLLQLPWRAEQQAAFEAMAQRSEQAQHGIEASDAVDFETFRQAYVAADGLLVDRRPTAQAQPA